MTAAVRPVRLWLQAAVAGLTLVLAAVVWAPPAWLALEQEQLFDRLLATLPVPADPGLRVVDIGAVDEAGAPWTRASTARLVQKLAEARPAIIGFDILFSGDCEAGATEVLAGAVQASPVVLGFLVSSISTLPPYPNPASELSAPDMWQAAGAEAACPALLRASVAAASMSLLGDSDARIRRVPALVQVAGRAYPTLALRLVQLARPDLAPPPLDRFGQVRFLPSPPAVWGQRTVAAADLLSGTADLAAMRGGIVLVGSSLPSRGGLRATQASPVHPSVQIHADLVQGLLAARLPLRPAQAALWEAGFVGLAGGTVLVLLRLLTAVPMLGVMLGVAGLWSALCLALLLRGAVLIDPAIPAIAALFVALLALIGQAAASARAEAALRARMAQVLPAAVVARIAATPGLLRLKGESRVITALFTDIEGFSLTTHQMPPEALVALLDRYFTLITAIALRHGAMIDKIVGDGLLALFNAPLDQPGHVDAALACAAEMLAATERLRLEPDLGGPLGRTRIGIECGPAILGDVGSGLRIDYTAHGDAINLASRLQGVNKTLGTAICVGPGAAALAHSPLRPLGTVEVRSFGPLQLYTLP
ncbi:MAG: adenylate/guanylate cyclase domain-containing protein [Pseudomonadota bacterium]